LEGLRTLRISLLKFLWIGFITISCTKTQSESSSEDDESETTIAEQPVWVDGAYLTCSWDSIESETEAGVRCGILDNTGAKIGQRDWKITWTVRDRFGAEVKYRTKPGTEFGEILMVMAAADIFGSRAVATIVNAQDQTTELFAEFNASLDGLDDETKLAACFNGDVSIKNCFSLVGINLPIGDTFTDTKDNAVSLACQNGPPEPGVMCSIKSDGFAGDLDFARKWFHQGNDLIAADGSIRSQDFCDASGIKEESARGMIDRSVRWFPYFDVGTSPCYNRFLPPGAEATASFGKHVIFNPEDGVGGEPFCYFMILEHPFILGGNHMRMHILLNPKIFPNAANVELVADDLVKTASYFSCIQ
jgi:hypothetical protein